MKKLMLLGGSQYLLPVIKTAHDLGIYVITCDYLPNNIAHKYSDEYCNVSVVNQDEVLEKAQELKIDGIMSFACDPGVTTAAYVAEEMGLAAPGPYESVCILQNKKRFREFLKVNGFNVPRFRSYRNIETALGDAELLDYPVIVKPTDSAGSKGVKKVERVSGMKEALENAFDQSNSSEVIVEEYLEQLGCASDSECFSVNGKLKFISFSAQRFDKTAENPYTPAAFSWPGTISSERETELKTELQRLLTLLGMNSSLYNVEVRECLNGRAYIMECSPRGGGNCLAEMLQHATGVDLIEAAVKAAMGLDFEIEQKPYNGNWAEIILHSESRGCFDDIFFDKNIEKYIVEKNLWVNQGDMVETFTGANKSLGTVVMKFDTKDDLEDVLKEPSRYIRINVRGI